MSAEDLSQSSKIIVNPFYAQPEFPEVDLTDHNAEYLELMLAHKETREAYHQAGEQFLVFNAFHPTLIAGAATTNEGRTVDALSHGMVMFEAITTAVTASRPGFVEKSVVARLIGQDTSVQLMTNLEKTQEVSAQFQHELPNTTRVIRAASERYFGKLTYVVIAGAGLECYLTKEALSLQSKLEFDRAISLS